MSKQKWYAFDCGGIMYCNGKHPYFNSKKEAVDYLSCINLDTRRVPLVKRLNEGFYEYFPKDCDTGETPTSGVCLLNDNKVLDYGYVELINQFLKEFEEAFKKDAS